MSKDHSSGNTSVWHITQLRVPLFEIDIGQAVYHGNYFHLFERARESFLRELGYPYRLFMEQETHLAVVEMKCSYKRSLRYDERIELRSRVNWWRSRSLAFEQQIFLADGQDSHILCTSATLNLVCVNFNGKPSILPADFVQKLEEWNGRSSQ